MKTNLIFVFIYFCIIGCQSSRTTSTAHADTLANIGGDTDKHGCLVSAGYTWSQLKNECVRPFETGIALHVINNASSYQSAAYVLIDSVKNEAEIFMPQENGSILLKKDSANTFTNGTFNLGKEEFCWTLTMNKTKLYQEQK